MNYRELLLLIGLVSLSSYAQERPETKSKELTYTYSKDGTLKSRLQKEIKHRKSSIFTEDTEDFLLYPNPADEFIIIDLKHFDKPKYYQLQDNLGKVIQHGELSNKITEVYFPELPKGVYFFTLLESNNELNTTRKIIKN